MTIDPENPVVALCAAGMAVEGDAGAALALFEQAWAARQDDYDACIAAHYVARHQPTPEATLHWNALALSNAERVTDGRATELMASLYLNFADASARVGNREAAARAAHQAEAHLAALPAGGYRDFTALGIRGLMERLGLSRAERAPADES